MVCVCILYIRGGGMHLIPWSFSTDTPPFYLPKLAFINNSNPFLPA